MNKFHEIHLPGFINCYISGGPHFDTNIVETLSGREIRHGNLERAVHKYRLRNCRLSLDELEQFNAFFLNCKGAEFAFRLKDYADYCATRQTLTCCLDDEKTIFPLFKKYDYQGKIYLRRIFKPVEESVQVFVDDAKIDHELDAANGTVKIASPLAPSQVLSASFCFDVPARFCCDSFSYQTAKDGSIILEDIEIKEII